MLLSDRLDKTFKKMMVNAIYLFGSQKTHFKHKESDIDIGVLFDDGRDMDKDRARTELYETLCSLFKTERVDVVFLRSAPLRLQFNAVTEGELLWTSDIEKALNYEEKIKWQYLDFVPILREFDNAVLSAKRK